MEKSANIQRKTLKGFKKYEELLIKTTLKKMTGVEESLAAMKKLVVAKEVLHSNEIKPFHCSTNKNAAVRVSGKPSSVIAGDSPTQEKLESVDFTSLFC